jgi:hypothetical protein
MNVSIRVAVAAATTAACGVVCGQSQNEPLQATLCDLSQSPRIYAGKIVQVRASIGYAETWLEDLTKQGVCPAFMNLTLEFPDRVKPDPGFKMDRNASSRQYEDARRRHMMVDVTIEGRFDPIFMWRDGERVRVEEGGDYGPIHGEDGRLVIRRMSNVVTRTSTSPDAVGRLYGWLKVLGMFAALLWIVWSGVRPSRSDPKKWYDRAIRTVGGMIIIGALLFGLILTLGHK